MNHKKTCYYALASVLLLTVGCSEQPTRYPVAGKVLIDGEPVPKGSIQFVPEKGRPFAGKINENGTFRLAELSVGGNENGPGVAPGMYQIGISSSEIVDEDSGEMLNHIPRKYADYRTSELEVEIDAPKEDMLIELTWEGSKELAGEVESEAEVAEADSDAALPEAESPVEAPEVSQEEATVE